MVYDNIHRPNICDWKLYDCSSIDVCTISIDAEMAVTMCIMVCRLNDIDDRAMPIGVIDVSVIY